MPSRPRHRTEPGQPSRAAFIRAQGDASVDEIIARGAAQGIKIDRTQIGKVRWLQNNADHMKRLSKKKKRADAKKKAVKAKAKTAKRVEPVSHIFHEAAERAKAARIVGKYPNITKQLGKAKVESGEALLRETLAMSIYGLVQHMVQREFRRVMKVASGDEA